MGLCAPVWPLGAGGLCRVVWACVSVQRQRLTSVWAERASANRAGAAASEEWQGPAPASTPAPPARVSSPGKGKRSAAFPAQSCS